MLHSKNATAKTDYVRPSQRQRLIVFEQNGNKNSKIEHIVGLVYNYRNSHFWPK